MSATLTLAKFVADTRYGDLPASLISECKIATLDVMAAAFVGSSLPWAQRVVEMVHDVRMISLNGTHRTDGIRPWMGDSIGRWDGDTLVVETTNFTDKTNYRGSTDQLRLVERFTRTAQDILTYRVTVHDPSTFTQPWTIELPVRRSDGEIYEYACHEANYGLEGILRGHRAEERVAAEAAAKKSPK